MKVFDENDSRTWLKCDRCGILIGIKGMTIKQHQREDKESCDRHRKMYDGDCNRNSKLSAQKLNRIFNRKLRGGK